MKVLPSKLSWLVVCCATAVIAGTTPFLDVSTGSHMVVEGERLGYVIARGDASVVISGGEIFGAGSANNDGALHGAQSIRLGVPSGSVIATDNAEIEFEAGSANGRVVSAGQSILRIGSGATYSEAVSLGHSIMTIEGSPAEQEYYAESLENSTLIIRGGRSARYLYAFDSSTIQVLDGEITDDLNSFGHSRVELAGGHVYRWVESWDDSEFIMTGGYVGLIAECNGRSRFTLAGGSVYLIWPRSEEPFRMTGGETREGVVDGSAFIASGGIIHGVVSANSPLRRFDVRSATYDHDANPDTAGVPLVFDESGIIEILPGDPRMRPVEDPTSQESEMLGVTVVWGDGSRTTFDIRGGRQNHSWGGRIEFHRVIIDQDLNADGGVDVLDLAILLTQWGQQGTADFNNDGAVDVLDLVLLVLFWG